MESKKSGSFKKIELNLFYNLPLPAILSSPEGIGIDVNEPALKLYKRSKKEWIGAKLEEMYEKSDTPKIRKAIEDCRNIGCSSCEVTAIRGDGVKFPAILNFSTLKDKEGNIIYIIGTAADITDITELRKRERLKEFAKSLFENLPIEATLLTPTGTRIDANAAFCTFFRKTKKEVINANMEEMYVKEDIPRLREAIENSKLAPFSETEVRMIRGDGRLRDYRVRFTSIRDSSGKIIKILGSGIDITELKRKEEYINSLLYSIPNPTSILDLDGKRIYTSKATEDYFKLPRDKILDAKAEELYDKRDLGKIRETLEKGRHGYASCETVCTRGDGTKFPAILSFAPVKDKDGNLINIAFSATDITKLRKREGKLRKRQQEQANAVSSLSKVLSKTVQGDLAARVDTRGWSEELATIGMAINTLIETLEFEKKEKS